MAPSAQTAGGRRVRRWTRETIIEKIREWEARYGEPPCSADWNPSLARWRAQEWRIERYREGIWPSTNAVKRPFGGSFDAAVRAAGFVPAPSRAAPRAAGVARPGVEPRAPLAPRWSRTSWSRRRARAPGRGARRRAGAPTGGGRAPCRACRGAAGEARRRARRAGEQAGRARRARDRSRAAERDARAAAASEVEARRHRRGSARARHDRSGRGGRARRDRGPPCRPAPPRRARPRPRRARRRPSGSSAAARARAGGRGRRRGVGLPPAAGARAAAERTARELATLVCGEARRLSADELEALRAGGPSGPAVLARGAEGARRGRARSATGVSWWRRWATVASAAIRWRDRL